MSNAAQMRAEADAFRATCLASAQAEVAPMIAEALKLEGEAQKLVHKAFAGKRTHEKA